MDAADQEEPAKNNFSCNGSYEREREGGDAK